jgi:hypothetical protein
MHSVHDSEAADQAKAVAVGFGLLPGVERFVRFDMGITDCVRPFLYQPIF